MTLSPESVERERDRKPYALTIRSGAAIAVDGAPPGESSSQVAVETTLRIWVRPEDQWRVDHLLRFWNQVAARPCEETRP